MKVKAYQKGVDPVVRVERFIDLYQIAENAMLRGAAGGVIAGRHVSAALRLGKGGKKLMWAIDGKRVGFPVLRTMLSLSSTPQLSLFDLSGLPVPESTPGGSPLTTLLRVPALFVQSVNEAYAQFMRESGESIAFADFLGLVLVAGLEGFGDA